MYKEKPHINGVSTIIRIKGAEEPMKKMKYSPSLLCQLTRSHLNQILLPWRILYISRIKLQDILEFQKRFRANWQEGICDEEDDTVSARRCR